MLSEERGVKAEYCKSGAGRTVECGEAGRGRTAALASCPTVSGKDEQRWPEQRGGVAGELAAPPPSHCRHARPGQVQCTARTNR